MRLLSTNKEIRIAGEDAVRAINEIELVLVSLHKIGSFYAGVGSDEFPYEEYWRETSRFIDEWRVTHRLARARHLLSSAFDDTLGLDDMDDLERAAQSVPYWSSPKSQPPPEACCDDASD